jgi:serine/threonine-protein kinase
MLGLVFYEMLTGSNPFVEVGRHLRGTDDEKRAEIRRLHLAARQMEQFALLERHEEIRQRPALGSVVRAALASDKHSRPFRNACEFQDAWQRAKLGEEDSYRHVSAWDRVRQLTHEAEQCLAVGDGERGVALLRQAMEINQNRSQVPDPMVVGRTYLLMVEHRLRRGDQEGAGQLAAEGYGRRPCRSTFLAMARYYADLNPPLATRFEQEAQSCQDQE